jgi:hypothetical protein
MTAHLKIDEIIDLMIELIKGSDQSDWLLPLSNIKNMLQSEPDIARRNIISMYGGMGSFSDVVLYKEGQLLTDESNKLFSLRAQLYESCYS